MGENWAGFEPWDDGNVSQLAFDFDNKTLYVSSNVDRDKRAIYKYDIANKRLGEQLVQHPLIDLQGGLLFSRAKNRWSVSATTRTRKTPSGSTRYAELRR